MSRPYRVVDVRSMPFIEETVLTFSAEEAGRRVVGMDLARGGNKRQTLIAKVYSTSSEGGLTMVRLYACAPSRASAPT